MKEGYLKLLTISKCISLNISADYLASSLAEEFYQVVKSQYSIAFMHPIVHMHMIVHIQFAVKISNLNKKNSYQIKKLGIL